MFRLKSCLILVYQTASVSGRSFDLTSQCKNYLNMNGTAVQPQQIFKPDANGFLRRTVQDLFSLVGRTIVITGGARGIGLALAFVVAEVGGNVAIIDVLSEPHPHYQKLQEFDVKIKLYKYVVRVVFPSGKLLTEPGAT